jgi:hypothetical protein
MKISICKLLVSSVRVEKTNKLNYNLEINR